MNLRPATLGDWEELLAIKSYYDTNGALQFDRQLDGDATITTLRPIRFPRALRIDPQTAPPEVPLEVLDDEHYIVAEEGGGELLGYLRTLADFDRSIGWITHLIVKPHHRRNHVGYTLLESAKRWAARSGLRHLQVETETRNAPAVAFLETCGFSLAGYNEHLVRDRIVVFYSWKSN